MRLRRPSVLLMAVTVSLMTSRRMRRGIRRPLGRNRRRRWWRRRRLLGRAGLAVARRRRMR
jgi:hypothetical protein